MLVLGGTTCGGGVLGIRIECCRHLMLVGSTLESHISSVYAYSWQRQLSR